MKLLIKNSDPNFLLHGWLIASAFFPALADALVLFTDPAAARHRSSD